ncbi:segregation/condensation protein A [Haloparvum sp. PAK95]|uniref:segregation/condensation protein A n=1 Tax=Haloparvum sp. PAK95 TaxID=3418962 RepID=UPI003D2F1D7F
MTEDDFVPDVDLTSDRDGAAPFGDDGDETESPATAADENATTDAGDASDESNDVSDDDVDDASDDSVVEELDITHPDETDEDEVEPVELLVQLAEEGEIEPWDIDIVQVTDAFLEKLDETDLRTSGRALFYASVLLRMKSDGMLADDDEDDEPEQEPWEVAMEGGEPDVEAGFDPVDQLEAEMDRRLERKSTRGSPETLDELVRELREAERSSWWKESREYDTSESPSAYDRGTQTVDYRSGDEFRQDAEPTAGDVTGGTHDEDIEAVIEDVEAALRTQYDKGRNEVLFSEVESAGGREFMTFLALLFLAHRGAVRLQQDELFGDLWIKDPSAPSVDAEAIAD